jgi:diaminopropionate ammonia-lyase
MDHRMKENWLRLFSSQCLQWCQNTQMAAAHDLFDPKIESIMSAKGGLRAQAEIKLWHNYEPTPLHNLSSIANELGISALNLKDESPRFGLGSFKALGGAYAVYRVLEELVKKETGQANVTSIDLRSGRYQAITNNITVVTATDGNHGKSVAWGAREFGCLCKVYIHKDVSHGRENAIAAFGCDMIRITGDYDESVRQTDIDARKNNWHVVSDTSYPGYMDVPRHVMQGYTILAIEISHQIGNTLPTHVFLPGGVGGIAAAVSAEFWRIWGVERPKVIIVEPEAADCLYQSALAKQPAHSSGNLETVMACLSAGEVSLLAWDILSRTANTFIILKDTTIAPSMQRLAKESIVSGESGAATLAGLAAVCSNPDAKQTLGLDSKSRVLLLSTEGATDPDIYTQLVGIPPNKVITNRPD